MRYFIILSFLLLSRASLGSSVPAIDPSSEEGAFHAALKGATEKSASKSLNPKERKALELARQWIDAKSLPVRSDDGKILYLYGSTLPTVICAPLSVCDIELEAGEKILGPPLLGDAVRWEAIPALSGSGSSEVSHVVVKAREVGIVTTMLITTSRRTYQIKLVSSSKNWTPRVGFTYPSDIEREWRAYNEKASQAKEKNTISETRENIEELNFEYEVKGSAPWKPVRVYNDGLKTIIQMPKEMAQTEAPALLVVGADGEKQIVNYRLKKDRYIVDQIFSKAILLAGVGFSQTSVTISYKESAAYKKERQASYEN